MTQDNKINGIGKSHCKNKVSGKYHGSLKKSAGVAASCSLLYNHESGMFSLP